MPSFSGCDSEVVRGGCVPDGYAEGIVAVSLDRRIPPTPIPLPAGADIVSYWRKRLPLEVVLDPKNKPGRTIKPLRERVERLCAKPETASDGARLCIFCNNTLCTSQLRPEKLSSLTEAELRASLDLAIGEHAKFPVKVKSALAEHRVATLQGRGDITRVLAACKPWSSAPFDPRNPCHGAIEVPLSSRLSTYKSVAWGRLMAPLLSSGEDNAERIKFACNAIVGLFADEDLLELDTQSTLIMQESCDIAKGIIGIVTLSTSPAEMRYIDKIANRVGKTDKSISTIAATAIYSNPWLASHIQLLIKAKAVIEELGGQLMQHAASLKDLPTSSISRYTMLGKMCNDYSRVRASNVASLWQEFGDNLLATVKQQWTETSALIQAKKLDEGAALLEALQSCMAEASTAFSLDDGIAELQGDVGALLAAESSKIKDVDLAEVGWHREHRPRRPRARVDDGSAS